MRPNVVLVNCDDLGYGDLSCYGSPVNETPRLDRMAAEGVRFDAFYMASPVCSPSRGAMLTGCYPPRIGFGSFDGLPVLFPGMRYGLSTDEVTLPRVLRDAGYRTQAIGKWHCGDQPEFLPTAHGFDHWFGLPYSNDMGRQVGTRTDARGDQRGYPPLPLMNDTEVVEQQPDQTTLTARYVDEAIRFIRSCDGEPFFLYLAHMYVHMPLYVEDRFAAASRNGRYGAAVAAIDWATGAILDELAALGLDEDTLVIFTSDNGSFGETVGGSNLPMRGRKTTTWEGGQRVPFIARWPRRIAPGRVTDQMATALDLLPTLATICGADLAVDRPIDGQDLAPLLLGDTDTSPRTSFAYFFMNDLEAVRDDRWKLHVAKHGAEALELYDLLTDPGETSDVAADHPDVVERMLRVADEVRRSLGDDRLGVPGPERRPPGIAANPSPLTVFDPDHPYFASEYDLPDRG